MMYLHEDKDLFRDVIEETNVRTGIAQAIIEKDYYVTMILKLLSERLPEIVFKGGTSLSKCFHLIDRFSEDIDVTFAEHIGDARRKRLKHVVIKSVSEELGVPIKNWDKTQSDRDLNCYIFTYQPTSDDPVEGIASEVRLETALASYAFPTEEGQVCSIIHDALSESNPDLIAECGLTPFSMKVQSVSRTFVDKLYALCDYYITQTSHLNKCLCTLKIQ